VSQLEAPQGATLVQLVLQQFPRQESDAQAPLDVHASPAASSGWQLPPGPVQ
jgi:hypothetical protein